MAQKLKPDWQSILQQVPQTFKKALAPGGWPTQVEWVVIIRIVAALLAAALIVICLTLVSEIALWDWFKVLIIPAAIAVAGILFNWSQQERDRQAQSRDLKVQALQGEKESVAYVAYQVLEEGLSDDDKSHRSELLGALCLAAVFAKSDRARALILAALEQCYNGPQEDDQKQKDVQKAIRDNLTEVHRYFESYKDRICSEKYEAFGDSTSKTGIAEHLARLEALQRILGIGEVSLENRNEIASRGQGGRVT
jgi:hypothetical protein